MNKSAVSRRRALAALASAGLARPFRLLGQTCPLAIAPVARSFGAGGGVGQITVAAPPGCAWRVVPHQQWISLLSGSSGTGDGIVQYQIQPAFASRVGQIEVGALTHTVSQAAVVALPSAAGGYLNRVLDQFQQRTYVYRSADAAPNHFAARGRFPASATDMTLPPMDEISRGVPSPSLECITARFVPGGPNFGGWYFQNGYLSGADRSRHENWGDVPAAGFDLSGASELVFSVRGAQGGERVEFFLGGVGRNPVTGAATMPYPDSAPKIGTGFVMLTNDWSEYRIPLAGADLSYVLGGFGWGTAADQNNGRSIQFYLDEIYYSKQRPDDLRFLLSWEAIPSDNPFDMVNRNAAFIYDNALALIYFTSMGDVSRARLLAEAVRYAIAHDRFYTDGRIRNAYQAGDEKLPPGWNANGQAATVRMPGWFDPRDRLWYEDTSHVSTSTGNVA
jgi:hypothetical protein